MDIAPTLARWVVSTPAIVRGLALARARAAVEDTVACMVAGAGDAGARAVREAVADYGDGPATVVGARRGAAAPWAALANGMAAHALDYDDNFGPGITHASAVLVPALLALGEERGASGPALLDAYVVGLEIHAVLGRGTGRGHYDLGWHSTSTVGGIGTAAACARLLGLDEAATTAAISLGVSMASGAKVQFGSPAKPFHAGMAAWHAVTAATLAEHGLAGRPDAIEGERGFRALYAGVDADWSALLAGLGAPLAIEAYGLTPKRYPCCGSAHRVLDGVLALRERHRFGADEVERVETKVGYGNKRNLCYDEPTQEMEARFSMSYCVSVALLEGRLRLADFTPEAVARPAVRALLPRISMDAYPPGAEGEDPTARLPHEVRIVLTDGRTLEESVLVPRGAADNPFTEADRAAKLADCCAGFLAPDTLAALRTALAGLGGLGSLTPLTRHLHFEAGGDDGARFLEREPGVFAS